MPTRFSLVFPLAEERGQTLDALRLWMNQTFPADRFEVVVVADDRLAVDPEIERLLRPHDRIARGRFANLAQQFDAGLRAGSGEYGFLTEAHCLPSSDCLAVMDRYLTAHPRLAGACCESIPAWANAYQGIDAATFEEGFRHFIGTNSWRKLSVHGTALKLDLYRALGGLRYEYGRYSEMVLAAALRDGGHKLGYARESTVTHHYRETLRELIDGTDDYVASESGYRVANPGPDRIGHTYQVDAVEPNSAGSLALERELALALLGRAGGGSTAALRTGLRAAWRAGLRTLTSRGVEFAEWFAMTACRVRCWFRRHDPRRLDEHYRELVRLASRWSRARALAAHPASDPPLPAPCGTLAIEALPEWALYGFHGLERTGGESFRWTGQVAAARIPLARGDYRLQLATRGLQVVEIQLRATFNGTRTELTKRADGDYEFAVTRSQCRDRVQTLILICNPLEPWRQGVKDYRALGVPLFAVEAIPSVARISRRAAA